MDLWFFAVYKNGERSIFANSYDGSSKFRYLGNLPCAKAGWSLKDECNLSSVNQYHKLHVSASPFQFGRPAFPEQNPLYKSVPDGNSRSVPRRVRAVLTHGQCVLLHPRSEVLQGQAYSSVVGIVRVRGMGHPAVVQWSLTRLKFNADCFFLINCHIQFLSPMQNVILAVCIVMWRLSFEVWAWKHFHAAAFNRGRWESNPYSHQFITIKTPIGQILVPWDVLSIMRFLDDVRRTPE